MKQRDWQKIILGIRKKLNLSQSELSKKLGISRQAISRFESKQRIPNNESINIILNFVSEYSLNIKELTNLGNDYSNKYLEREKVSKLNLNHSEELAELIGIILGDGEIRKDGTIRISFDPKKDENFLYRRIYPLVHNLLGNKINFESYKRIAFGNIAFVRYLKEKCNLKPGSKFENNWKIPKWCFEKQEYISAVLRGLFDTDGYIGYWGGSLDLMFGRFSDRCTKLVEGIENGLISLGFKPIVRQSKDGRYRIRLTSKEAILKFFMCIGSSNIKHVVRFLLWRIKRYEAKIELEGLNNLIKNIHKSVNINIKDANLPFLWNLNNKYFQDYIKGDISYINGVKIRKLYKWTEVIKRLTILVGAKDLAENFNITQRSVRKWREGKRNPSNKFIIRLMDLSNKNNLNLNEYKVK